MARDSKIYQIVVCLLGSRQQTLSEEGSFVKYQENENLQQNFACNYNGYLGVMRANWPLKDKLSLTYQNLAFESYSLCSPLIC